MQSWQTGIKTLSRLLGLKPSWFGILKELATSQAAKMMLAAWPYHTTAPTAPLGLCYGFASWKD